MKRIWLLFLLFCDISLADDIRLAPGLVGTAAITFFVDENQVVQIDRSKPILVGSLVGTTPPIDPDQPPPTDPPPVSDPLAVKVSTLVTAAPKGATEANARKTMAGLYSMTGKLPLTDPTDIQRSTTILFNSLPMSPAWKKWKSDVDAFGSFLDIVDIKRAWQLIAEGLGSSGAEEMLLQEFPVK